MGASYSSQVFPVPSVTYNKSLPNYVDIPFTAYSNDEKSCLIQAASSTYHEMKFVPSIFIKAPNLRTEEDLAGGLGGTEKYTNKTIIYSHGNACDLGQVYDYCKHLSETLSVNVIAYDYTGYGISKGVPSEKGCIDSLKSVYNFVVEENPNAEIILLGSSVGTGPTIKFASELGESNQLMGVILIAPYTSIIGVVSEKLAKLVWMIDMFRNIDNIGDIICKILIFHGTNDNVIPYDHAVKLHAKCSSSRLVTLRGGDHHNLDLFFTAQMDNEISMFCHE